MRETDEKIILDERNADVICRLITEYSDELIRYICCYTHDFASAEDIAEDAFATLVFRHKKFACKAAFKSYLYKTARSRSIDWLRERRRYVAQDGAPVQARDDAEENFFKNALKAEIYDCIALLPAQYGEALCLCYIDGFSADEMSAILGCNKKRVYNLLSRAKAALRPLLTERGICNENL